MISHDIPLDSPIEEKIAWAEDRFDRQGPGILKAPGIASLLDRFAAAAEASHRQMVDTGIVEVCRACDLEEGGSCCGKGIENRYSGLLLLVNRLLGCSLPAIRHDPAGCFFLGKEGCLLQARHVICINYLCKKITDRFSPKCLTPLREREGEEIDLLFLLSERVRKALRRDSRDPMP